MDSRLLHPYDFLKEGDSTYYFNTDNGLKYKAYFVEFSASFYKLFSFSFDKEEGGGAPFDPRVKDTIISVLRDFFDTENYVLGYTCDVTDGKEMARKRLFDRWFEQENDGSLRKIDFQTDNIFVSLIVNKEYFAIEQVVTDINNIFEELQEQK